MHFRWVVLVGMISAAAAAGATTSCSGPDPGYVEFRERSKSGELTSGGVPVVDSGPGTPEGGTTEAGVDAGPKGDPVFGTTAFMQGNPPSGGPAKGRPQHVPPTVPTNLDPSGIDCVVAGCHLDARPWAFAGTLYTDATGTARVAGAEIRVTGPDGKLVGNTYSDADGNFWLELGDPKLPANSRVGVRNGTKILNMAGTISGQTGCSRANGCHGSGTPGKVFLK